MARMAWQAVCYCYVGMGHTCVPQLGVGLATYEHASCCVHARHFLHTFIHVSKERDCLYTCLACCLKLAVDLHLQVGLPTRVMG